jgi:Carbohydrate-selective porin, OprB family.
MTFGNPYKNNGGGRLEELTQSYGLYTGAQLTKDIQAYLDIQLFKGNGVGYGQGIGGYPNSLYIRAGSSQYIRHPGYDKNRGPLWVYGLRVNAQF